MSSTPSTIKIISINVSRSSSAHEIALETATNLDTDVLLIQEPYIFKDSSRKITRNHPSFECFSPVDDWSRRPRVLTYTKKASGLLFTQIRPDLTPGENRSNGDILFLTVQAPSCPPVTLINVYNAPTGATNPGAGLLSLISLSDSLLISSTVLIGDLNLHHTYWQPSYAASPSTQSDNFIRWLNTRSMSLISEPDIPTHNRGNFLDLCLASDDLLARGIIAVRVHMSFSPGLVVF